MKLEATARTDPELGVRRLERAVSMVQANVGRDHPLLAQGRSLLGHALMARRFGIKTPETAANRAKIADLSSKFEKSRCNLCGNCVNTNELNMACSAADSVLTAVTSAPDVLSSS